MNKEMNKEINVKIENIKKNIHFMYYKIENDLNTNEIHTSLSQILFKSNQDLLFVRLIMAKKNINNKYLLSEIQILEKELKIINEFHLNILHFKKKRRLDILTLVNTIFLPLSLIVGYFGMNFKSMGGPGQILTNKNGQILVFTLFAVTISICIYLMVMARILPNVNLHNKYKIPSRDKT